MGMPLTRPAAAVDPVPDYRVYRDGVRTSQVAHRAGVNVQTLRYYQRRGLLPEPQRTPAGYRRWEPNAVRTVRFVKQKPCRRLQLSVQTTSEPDNWPCSCTWSACSCARGLRTPARSPSPRASYLAVPASSTPTRLPRPRAALDAANRSTKPVVGLVLGVLVLGESLTVWEVVGSTAVVAAMALVARAGRAPCDRLRCWQQSGHALTEGR
jgi:MerR family regulatory protein